MGAFVEDGGADVGDFVEEGGEGFGGGLLVEGGADGDGVVEVLLGGLEGDDGLEGVLLPLGWIGDGRGGRGCGGLAVVGGEVDVEAVGGVGAFGGAEVVGEGGGDFVDFGFEECGAFGDVVGEWAGEAGAFGPGGEVELFGEVVEVFGLA